MEPFANYIIDYGYYFIAAAAAGLFLAILRGRRRIFVIPAVIMGALIINPLFRYLWVDGLHLQYYWRVLWIVPVIPFCACLAPAITEKLNNSSLKGGIAVTCAAVFVLTGTFIYSQAHCYFFIPAENMEKLPQPAIEIAEALLELEDHPRVVAEPSIGIYLRQYSSDIDLLYGRDIYGYIKPAGSEAQRVQNELNNEGGNYEVILDVMRKKLYDYLVIPTDWDYGKSQLGQLGYIICSDVAGYQIYKAPVTSVKERDQDGRILSAIYIDQNGDITDGPEGYEKVLYTYANNGTLIERTMVDMESSGGRNRPDGTYGLREEYALDGSLISRRYLDKDGSMMMCREGYAEARWEKDEKGIRFVAFYDDDGQLTAPEGKNVVPGTADSWTCWMKPDPEKENCCFTVGRYALGEKHTGDVYTCRIEIEFSGVQACEELPFAFWTQGAADQEWGIGNVWNSSLVTLDEAPTDGVYENTSSVAVTEPMTAVSWFDIGFRCDNWASGKFRVRGIRIEKEDMPTLEA